MDDLYGDLENYEFENVVSELRNENQELKCKVEEYSTTLASLQKDFDNLTAEYKKLELNYSSLLKTARAEIERKSLLITNLNIEKDKLVISSIQNRGRLPNTKINASGKKQQTTKQLVKEKELPKQELGVTTPNADNNVGSVTLNHDRKDTHDKTIVSLGPSLKDDSDVNEKEQNIKKSDLHKDNQSDTFNKAAVETKVSKIENRRKSMPLLNRGDFKFSSDEDIDDASKDHRFRRKTPIRDDRIIENKIDRHHDKYRNNRNDPERKIHESARVGDRHTSNYDTSREAYRKISSRYRDNDRHKSRDNRDKYESSQRSRKHYSPDRAYNTQGEYYNKYREPNDRTHRFDNVKHRTLVSPPSEKYNQHQRSREFDGQRFHHDGAYPMKHKRHDAVEEPSCKRLRSESLNKQPDKHMSLYDKDVDGRANSMSRALELSYLSLQSPDYVHLENNPPIPIKEIKCTSDTKLDDPRLTNKKYIVGTYKDKVVLSTVVGRDVDIKAIDTSTWSRNKNQQLYQMPIALREKPPISEDFVKDICMGIDNPIPNLSLQSGEICLEGETGILSKNKAMVKTDMATVISEDTNIKLVNNIQSYDPAKISKKETNDVIDIQETCPTLFSKNYRIPKIKSSNTPKLLDDDSISSAHNKLHKKDKPCHKKKSNKKKKDLDKKIRRQVNEYNSLKMFSDATDAIKSKSHKYDTSHSKHSQKLTMVPVRDTVEGDLELSDETCDYVEVSDELRYDKGNNVQKLEARNKNELMSNIEDLNIESRKSEISDRVNKECTVNERETETLREKKHFVISHKGHEVQPRDTLSGIYKEQKSKDIKSKISDLFGDTSSLITLDDLGIVTQTTTKENLNVYGPLFENTQDAVDLNVEEMEQVQTRSMKLKPDEDPFKNDNKDATEKIEINKNKYNTNKEKQNFNDNIKKSSSIQHIFENVNAAPVDNSVVKTVIISTGIQNNCDSLAGVHDGEQGKQLTTIETKANNAKSCPAVLNIKALATSTPYKPQSEHSLSVPEISCNSNNSTTLKDVADNSSNIERASKAAQNDLDIPDVRIIVKRRRKGKGAPS